MNTVQVLTKAETSNFYYFRELREEFYSYRPGDVALAFTTKEVEDLVSLARGLGWVYLFEELKSS